MLSNERIAILEDDPISRERLSDYVKGIGGVPAPVGPRAPALVDFNAFLGNEGISMVVCDHRLFERGNYAAYYGAEALKEAYRSGRGGVLVTAWEKDDAELSIREYRRWIPALIHSTDLRRNTLESALLLADREARQHQPAPQRIGYRSIMAVTNLIPTGDRVIVKVVMSQWNPNLEVGFPLHMLPEEMRRSASPGNLLIAQVNLDAECAEDLFFDEFELPDPDVLKKSKAFFNRP